MLKRKKFYNDNYKGKHIHMKLDGSPGAEFKIKASDYMYFGCEYNKNPWAMGIELNKGEEYTFYKPSPEEDEVNGKKFAQNLIDAIEKSKTNSRRTKKRCF
mgnify:CR=1 FL=1